MQILPLTIVIISLILLGAIVGIYIQGRFADTHHHIDAACGELKLEITALHIRILEIERGKSDTEIEAETVQKWDEITDPNYRWDKQTS
jgi:disulfide bond formation protein DsbB